jgi:CSLREA domain-containing protein
MASQLARSSDHRALPSWGWRCCGLGLLVLIALAMGTAGASRADAATTITVNTTSDETVTDGQCSLREAINNANANADTTGGDCLAGSLGVDTIDMSSLSGTILLSIPNDFGRSTLPTLTDDVTITGPGASKLTIKQTGLGRVMAVGGGVTTAVSGVTITGGSGQGGGIFVAGTLTLSGSAVSGNGFAGGAGGASLLTGSGR